LTGGLGEIPAQVKKGLGKKISVNKYFAFARFARPDKPVSSL